MCDTDIFGLPPVLSELLKRQYGDEVTEKIESGCLQKRTVSLRINPLKGGNTSDELLQAGINLAGLEWYGDAYLLPSCSEADVEKLPAYSEGRVYLQSLSSMIPPLVLDPRPDTDILDMAAAPGGKTTEIAALTSNKCRITACERDPIRAQRLKYNLEKQGVSCAYVMVTDSRTLSDAFSFDKILLDAPCSGSGTLNLGMPNTHFTRQLIDKCIRAQKALILKALSLLKVGGELVYSTCSILEEENEEIVRYALDGSDAEIVPVSGFDACGVPLLQTSLAGTLCICPDINYEGFFVAKIKKTGRRVKTPQPSAKQKPRRRKRQ